MPLSGFGQGAAVWNIRDRNGVESGGPGDCESESVMRKALKISGWSCGTAAALFGALLVLKSGYLPFYPKVWGATITVDGKPSRGSSVYLNRWGLLVRQVSNGKELYVFAGDDESGFVWRCEASSFLVVPGIAALTNNERVNRGCIFLPFGERDVFGRVAKKPKAMRNQWVTGHLLEFTAEDGKRVRAEW